MPQLKEEDFFARLRIVVDRFRTRKQAADIAGVSLDAVTRYLRAGNQPSFVTVSKLCHAASASIQWLASGEGSIDQHHMGGMTRGIPLSGFSETPDTGWYSPQRSSVQTTLDLPDPRAFATVVNGQSLIPEGIQPGFICICSPLLTQMPGDIIHLRRQDGLCTLRLYAGDDKDWLVLKAYTDCDGKNMQRPFEDRIKRSTVTEIAPVVFVRRKS